MFQRSIYKLYTSGETIWFLHGKKDEQMRLFTILGCIMLSLFCADEAYANLKLPYPGGDSWTLTRGYNTETHKNYGLGADDRYALDFVESGCQSLGKSIVAMATGTVSTAEYSAGWGNFVIVDEQNGCKIRYAHLSTITVGRDDEVFQGQELGIVGNTGNVSGVACPSAPGMHVHVARYCDNVGVPFEPVSGYASLIVGEKYTSDNNGNPTPTPTTHDLCNSTLRNTCSPTYEVSCNKILGTPTASDPSGSTPTFAAGEDIIVNAKFTNVYGNSVRLLTYVTRNGQPFTTKCATESSKDCLNHWEGPYSFNGEPHTAFINPVIQGATLVNGNTTNYRFYICADPIGTMTESDCKANPGFNVTATVVPNLATRTVVLSSLQTRGTTSCNHVTVQGDSVSAVIPSLYLASTTYTPIPTTDCPNCCAQPNSLGEIYLCKQGEGFCTYDSDCESNLLCNTDSFCINPTSTTGNETLTIVGPTINPIQTTTEANLVKVRYMYVVGGSDPSRQRSNVVFVSNDIAYDQPITAWRQTTPLPQSRGDHTVSAIGKYLIITGGVNATAYTSTTDTVLIGQINVDGDILSWERGSSLPEPRRGHSAIVWNEHVCVSGGATPTHTNGTSNTLCAYFDRTTGTLSSWYDVGSGFNGARYNHWSTDSNDHIYVGGGYSTEGQNIRDDVQSAQISLTNGRIQLGQWFQQNGYATGRFTAKATALKNRLYFSGGTDDPSGSHKLNDVQHTAVSANGTTDIWAKTAPMTDVRSDHSMTAIGNSVYIVGGTASNGITSQVLTATPTTNGSVTGWTEATPLPEGRYMFDTAIATLEVTGIAVLQETATTEVMMTQTQETTTPRTEAKYLYAIGGSVSQDGYKIRTNVAYVSDITDGSPQSWRSTLSLPATRGDHTVNVIGNRIFVVGGVSGGGYTSKEDTVLVGEIDENGDVLSWNRDTPLPSPRRGHSTIVWGDFICVSGGSTSDKPNGSADTLCNHFYSQTSKTLGDWYDAGSFFRGARYNHWGAISEDYLYIGGGYANGIASDVQRAQLSLSGGVVRLTPWTNEPSFQPCRFTSKAVTINNTLYFAGGTDDPSGSHTLGDVQKSVVASNGSLTQWSTTSPLQYARADHGMTAIDNNIFVAGGIIQGGNATTQVLMATPNQDNTITGWIEAAPLPNGLYNFGMTAVTVDLQ